MNELPNKKACLHFTWKLCDILNKDVLKIIFEKLNRRDLISAKGVCKHFWRVALMCIYYLPTNPSCDIELKPFRYLTTLYLNCNQNITNEGLKFAPLLTTLELFMNEKITDE